jgi:DNA-binding transcriptional LysR family regulator
MRRLENLIGAELTDKGVSGVVLTECGIEVLRHAHRILTINDQIVSGGGEPSQLQVIRAGIPNLFAAAKLRQLIKECRSRIEGIRLQVCCDHSRGLIRSLRGGYLDLALVILDGEEAERALQSWSEELVWMRSPDVAFDPDQPVPLVSSPNLLVPDRIAMDALEQAGRPYEIVFTAFDMMARRAAVDAGLGYLPILRSLLPSRFVEEEPGVLPVLPPITIGVALRDDLDIKDLTPLIETFADVLAPSHEADAVKSWD